jgi:hypothetical protein
MVYTALLVVNTSFFKHVDQTSDKSEFKFRNLHLFVGGDPLDRFKQIGNDQLYQVMLLSYYSAGYSLIENGDIEDLWMREQSLSAEIYEDLLGSLGFPVGDYLEDEYEDNRVRSQAFKIFDNNAEVYNVIRNLFHNNSRFIRVAGNHDDYWRSEEYLPGLQMVYPGIKVFDYVFIGNYEDGLHNHNNNSPYYIIAHGHQMDAWNTYACRTAGAYITESASGIPSLAAEVTERSEWENKLLGAGFENELSESLASIDEVEFYQNITDDFSDQPYTPHFIIGHTHHGLKDPLLPGWDYNPSLRWTGEGRFSSYTNDGTAGRWEEFIWCASVDQGRVGLHGWTWDTNGNPIVYNFDGTGSNNLQAVSVSN